MQKSRIEWCDYTINPVKGLCPMACPYCYARRMYKRFHWDETIRFDLNAYRGIATLTEPSRIFVGSTMELFGDWVDESTLWHTFNVVRQFPQHTFIFLTKQPQNLIKWSPFPDNCWVGVSATDERTFHRAVNELSNIKASVRFISVEPLLQSVNVLWVNPEIINWLIIGQQTPVSAKTTPKIEWIQEIVEAADKARIPVFLKDNLKPLFVSSGLFVDSRRGWAITKEQSLRQEFPVDSKE